MCVCVYVLSSHTYLLNFKAPEFTITTPWGKTVNVKAINYYCSYNITFVAAFAPSPEYATPFFFHSTKRNNAAKFSSNI